MFFVCCCCVSFISPFQSVNAILSSEQNNMHRQRHITSLITPYRKPERTRIAHLNESAEIPNYTVHTNFRFRSRFQYNFFCWCEMLLQLTRLQIIAIHCSIMMPMLFFSIQANGFQVKATRNQLLL